MASSGFMITFSRLRAGQFILRWMAATYPSRLRNIPIQAKSIRMVSKHLAGEAEHAECLAKEADKRGDIVSARELYRIASEKYREAQHFSIPIISDWRWELYESCRKCAERLYEINEYPIELVSIPSEISNVPGVFHKAVVEGRAPAVVFIPGME